MTKKQFEHEMIKAQTFQTVEPDRAFYWIGYQRGLRRAFHGEAFGTEAEHVLLLQAVDVDDPDRRQRGEGYRDGLQGKCSMAKDYCTQNAGDCQTCSLVNYGRDCMNNSIEI